MNTGLRLLYWGITGALLGYGFIALFGIGLPFVLVGLVLIIAGASRLGPHWWWAGLIGFGLLPALALAHDLLTAGASCPTNGRLAQGQSCVDVSGYRNLVVAFGAVVAAGLLIGLVTTRMRRRHHQV